MKKILNNLIPDVRQELILSLFVVFGYSISKMNLEFSKVIYIYSIILLLFFIWLLKIFSGEKYSKQYKGFIVLIVGVVLFSFGLYSFLKYLFYIFNNVPDTVLNYFYLGFPLWIMLEGLLILFILNFEYSSKNLNLENKIRILSPIFSDYFIVIIASVILLVLGEFIIDLVWYINVALVLSINIVIINQFAEK